MDETCFLPANRHHATIYATGLVDLEAKMNTVEGNTAADLQRWTKHADPKWIAGIEVVATDLAESFRAGLSPMLATPPRVADPFHVDRVGNRCLDKPRRRGQNETLGHRGRKVARPTTSASCSPPVTSASTTSRNRKLLGLRVGDPHDEVLGAWLAKESVRDAYLADDAKAAALLLDKASRRVHGRRCRGDPLLRQHAVVLANRDPCPPPPAPARAPPKGSTSA